MRKILKKDSYLKGIPGAIPRTVKRVRSKKVTMKERDIQGIVEQYLDMKGLAYFRIPDQVLKTLRWSSGPAVGRLVSEYFAGWPDLMIFKGMGKDLRCLPLELKTEAGRLSQGQVKIQARIGTIVAYGVEDAIKTINEWIDLPFTESDAAAVGENPTGYPERNG